MGNRITKRQRRMLKQSGVLGEHGGIEPQKFNRLLVKPKTRTQAAVWKKFEQGDNIVLHGSAGTGKTFIALYLAIDHLINNAETYEQILIIRSVVPSRDIGFLPGSVKEKQKIYELPYEQIINQLVEHPRGYQFLKDNGTIEFATSSFIRGLTIDNTIVIVDECQNMNHMELHSIITRFGENCRFFLCGDICQNDLINRRNEQSGFGDVIKIMDKIKNVSVIEFNIEDVVRSGFVKDYIITRSTMEQNDEIKRIV